jgi:hypothetical protein
MKFHTLILAALLAMLPVAANTAELPLPKLHRVVHHHHLHAGRTPQPHFGYYFGRWGWRWGGTARTWYNSTFVLAGRADWGEPPVSFASGPPSNPVIACPPRRPLVCLAEPALEPVALAGRSGWR